MKQLYYLIAVFALFLSVNSQIHYVPAQILIPTFNGSVISGLNNTSKWNSTYNNTQSWNQTNYSDGNLFVGYIGNFDRLLFNQVYIKPGRWWSSREKIIEYPKDIPGGYVRHETISAIRVYNQYYDGNYSNATILAGGVGSKYVKIRLVSNWGKGFKYLVQIFGH